MKPTIEHAWELVEQTGSAIGRNNERLPIRTKAWVCKNCKMTVLPTKQQFQSNSFGKPSKKRKVDGMDCGEIIALHIHSA